MAIVKRTPRTLMSPFRWGLTDWFDPLSVTSDVWGLAGDTGFYPNMEGYRKGDEFHVRAELPGVNPKDVDISVDDIHLCIKGVRSQPETLKDADYYFEEMNYGSFERCFHIPRDVDVQKMHAKYENGLLDISIPLSKTGKGRHISIEGVKEEKK